MTPANPSRADWRKSTYSGQDGNCAEVSGDRSARVVVIRDTQDRDGFLLRVPGAEWSRFTSSIK
ncbi:MAG: DUF397 domain-containing protein [Streptosporangiales bacterium]|jgi:hypothetical protein|nr:DUF397 domain-containing protein [Streptosporangiales bacterium]